MADQPRYRVRPVVKPLPSRTANASNEHDEKMSGDPFVRPEAEDDDGYDPFSDRPPALEPTFQEDPWR